MKHPSIGWPLAKNRIRRGLNNHTFGMVRRRADGTKRPHQGWDFEAPNGTPCFAVAAGTIVKVVEAGAYGKQVTLRFAHDFDGNGKPDILFAFYAHLSRFDVREGQQVGKGQQVGLTGSSGNAVGMSLLDQHLHFELRIMATPPAGLTGRISPLAIFGVCPFEEAIV